MQIEWTKRNQLTITVSSSLGSFRLQRLIDYVKYLEATAGSKAKQADVDKLSDEVNANATLSENEIMAEVYKVRYAGKN